MLTKIVHRTRDCVGIIAGFQHIDGPLEVKYRYWRGGSTLWLLRGVDDYDSIHIYSGIGASRHSRGFPVTARLSRFVFRKTVGKTRRMWAKVTP